MGQDHVGRNNLTSVIKKFSGINLETVENQISSFAQEMHNPEKQVMPSWTVVLILWITETGKNLNK